jgi:hypothetical protein
MFVEPQINTHSFYTKSDHRATEVITTLLEPSL